MNIKKYCFRIVILFLAIMILCISCTESKGAISSLDREKLFSLSYGRFENELDLFDIQKVHSINTHIFMQDGIFAITDGKSKKIMQLTSYGDLLAIYYNQDTNPTPSFASEAAKQTPNLTTQQAIPYSFNNIGKITIDAQKNMYIVDQIPLERQEKDRTKGLLLKESVLHFAPDGSYVDYIGQEGIGGTPFPFILDLYTTNNREIVVVSQSTTGVTVHWFSPEIFLRSTIPIHTSSLPSPYGENEPVYKSLGKTLCDFNTRTLYLKIDYYAPKIDVATNVQEGISYKGTYTYPLDIETGLYGEPIAVPPLEEVVREGTATTLYEKPYDLIGISESGWLFFMVSDDTGYSIQLINSDNHRIIKRHIEVRDDELLYNTFAVSKEGILSALLANEFSASLVWWRTDFLIGEVRR